VVAEGTAYGPMDEEIPDPGNDLLGNPIYPDFGEYLKERIREHCHKEKKFQANVTYIDPMHMIRSSPANSMDSKLGA